MNSVVLIGRLTRDPELRYIPGSGNAVANLNIAVDRPYSKEKIADFFRVVVFGKPAENCSNYLAKGSQVAVEGRIQNNNYEDKNGVKHYGNDIIANRVEFLSKADSASNVAATTNSSSLFDDAPEGFQSIDDDDDEIPF